MAREKHLINVHTSSETEAPTGASLYLGEIAVQHTPDNPALWIKVGTTNNSNVYERFMGETEIIDILENTEIVLGTAYTYTGIPYVNSATSISDAYSALTEEMFFRDNSISGKVDSLSAAVVTISANTSGPGTDYGPLSSATHSHITNDDIHVTSSDKTTWSGKQDAISDLTAIRNGANSGASAYTAVTVLSAATTAHTANTNIHVPTGGTNGQFLSLVNGSPAWVNPVNIYSGTTAPAQNLGNNGDIYLQLS